jgi:hypothetical protein
MWLPFRPQSVQIKEELLTQTKTQAMLKLIDPQLMPPDTQAFLASMLFMGVVLLLAFGFLWLMKKLGKK